MAHKVGLVGLGAIGHPLAANMIAKGIEVHGYRRGSTQAFEAIGGLPAASPKAIGETCDIVLTVLPSADDVREVYGGENGLLAAGREGLVLVEISTLPMEDKEDLRTMAEAAGAIMLDAPLSGVPKMVEDRAAIIFASGDKAAYDRFADVFAGMTDKAFHLGEFGVGTKMKFVANALVGIHILAAAEAMALGIKAGLDRDLMLKVLSPSAGTSLQFQVRAPLMAERKYDPVLAPNTVLGKDLVTIAKFADDLGCPAPLTHVARDYFRKSLDTEWAKKDVASIIELVAEECGLKL